MHVGGVFAGGSTALNTPKTTVVVLLSLIVLVGTRQLHTMAFNSRSLIDIPIKHIEGKPRENRKIQETYARRSASSVPGGEPVSGLPHLPICTALSS